MSSTAQDAGARLVAWAEEQLGKPYLYGAEGPSAYDCSGLVQSGGNAAGVKLPRVSSEQFASTARIEAADLQPGDLVFSEWAGDDVPHHGHVAIYAGNGMIIEAPHTGASVQKVPLDQAYLAHVDGYGRIPAEASAGATAGATSAGYTATPAGLSLGSILGGIFSGGLGGGGIQGGVTGGGLGSLGNIGALSDAIGKSYDMLVGVFNFWQAFFRPSTYIRIAAGLFGAAFTITGIVFLAREAKTAP